MVNGEVYGWVILVVVGFNGGDWVFGFYGVVGVF